MDRTTGRTPFRANWDLCALCQGENKNDKLVSPVNSTGRDSRSGYKTVDNLPYRGTQREYSSKPLKHSIVKRILVFKR